MTTDPQGQSAEKDGRLRCDACRCGQHGDCSDGDCLCPDEFCNGWGMPATPPTSGDQR